MAYFEAAEIIEVPQLDTTSRGDKTLRSAKPDAPDTAFVALYVPTSLREPFGLTPLQTSETR